MNQFQKMASILVLVMTSQGVGAYNYYLCSDGTPMYLNDNHPTFNYANNMTTAEKTVTDWAFNRLTYFSDSSITTVDNGDSSFSSGNGQNEIYHFPSIDTADCSYWFIDSPTCDVTETDIRLGDETWYTAEDSQHLPYGTVGRSVQGIMVHEGGHCIGLGHTNNLYNVMGNETTHVTRNSITSYYGPGEDASDALIDLHGKRSTTDIYRDVGVTAYGYDHADGEYSEHEVGSLWFEGTTLPVSGSWAPGPTPPYSSQTVWEVQPGQTIRMQVTFENNGEKNAESVNVGYYLSINSQISTSDTLVKTENGYTFARGAPYETLIDITIPSNTAPGNYFLGAFVDHYNLIPEATSNNNVAYYAVSVPPPDLIVQGAIVSNITLMPNEIFIAAATVTNVGAGASPATTLKYYRSNNSHISQYDTQIGADSVGVLAAAAGSPENALVSAGAAIGTFWIGACVDSVPGESSSSNQCSNGVQVTVTTPPPTIATSPATNISATGATLKALVNPNGTSTTVYFDYQTLTGPLQTIVVGDVGAVDYFFNVSAVTPPLVCETTYYFSARATNIGGTTNGEIRSFTTGMCAGCGG